MLKPRKNSLIDGQVTIGNARRLRRWQMSCAALMIVIAGLIAAWPSSRTQADVADEVWWRRLISSVVLKRLAHDVDASTVGEMKQRIAQLEAERTGLAERLAEADKLLHIDRSQQRLAQVVARRDGGDISFEILLRNPEGGRERSLDIDVLAVRNPAVATPGMRTGSLSLDVDRSTRLAVRSPKVAETLQGRLPSAGSHLLVMVTPANGVAQAEAVLVPVSGNP